MLKNKKGIIFGIANDHSIAWGIAKKLSENGAEIIITYQNETKNYSAQDVSVFYINKGVEITCLDDAELEFQIYDEVFNAQRLLA